MARYAREGIDIPWGGAAEDGRDPADIPREQRGGSGGARDIGGPRSGGGAAGSGATPARGIAAFLAKRVTDWLISESSSASKELRLVPGHHHFEEPEPSLSHGR